MIASRAEVARFPNASEVVRLFGKMARAEEHVFYNVLLHRLHYSRDDIEMRCVTYQRFSRHDGYRAPLSCRTSKRGVEIENEQKILQARNIHGCLFARKFRSSCDLRCLVASEFERFQC